MTGRDSKGRFAGGNPGKQKGQLNKLTRSFRTAVLQTFDGMGGVPAFLEWAKSEPTEFYKIASRLIPKELDVTVREVRPVIVDLVTPEELASAHEASDVH